MNKISNKVVARAIYESVKGKSGEAMESSIKNSVAFIARKNFLSKSAEILGHIQDFVDTDHGTVRAKVLSKKKPSPKAVEQIKHFLQERFKAKDVHLDWKEDESVLGGVRIEAKDEVIDLSLRNKIDQLQNHLLEYSTQN